MSDQERGKVVVPYVELQKKIDEIVSKPPSRLPSRPPSRSQSIPPGNVLLKAFQTTLCSMEPMVYDLDECVEGSPCRNYIEEFLSLVEDSTKFISSDEIKLKTTRTNLKALFTKHVNTELDAAWSIQVADGQVEMELQRLVSYLGSTIRLKLVDGTPKLPVLRNIDIILDNLKQDSGGKESQLLNLLNRVKVLLKFFKGDHDIKIPERLLNCEELLRKDFVTEEGLSELKKLDRKDKEKTIGEWKLGFTVVGGIALAMAFQNKSLNAFFISAGCLFAYHCVDGFSSNSTNTSNQKNRKQRKKYDIFLNFRGSDVRYNFAGVLKYNLEKENISTFFDETSIPKSKEFWEEIKTGIDNSIGAITIFSKRYAESVDCLDELVLVRRRERESQKKSETYKITPVFFDIPTTDLQPVKPPEHGEEPEPESKFRADLKKHDKDKLVEREEAITRMLSLNGHVHHSGHHHMYKLIDDIVKEFKTYVRTRGIQSRPKEGGMNKGASKAGQRKEAGATSE